MEKWQEFYENFSRKEGSRSAAKSIMTLAVNTQGWKDIEIYNFIQLNDYIVRMNPDSVKKIENIIYILREYARYIDCDNLYITLGYLDKNNIWDEVKNNIPPKYLSHSIYLKMLDEMKDEELFTRVLFMSIYEGIYDKKLSVFYNMRASDIVGNFVTLKPIGKEPYLLGVSSKLVNMLLKLSEEKFVYKRNMYKEFKLPARGVYSDSVFKFNTETLNLAAYKGRVYRQFRRINEMFATELSPGILYISGIVYRIQRQLRFGTLEQAFSSETEDKDLIPKELKRCNYYTSVTNFKNMVSKNLQDFE